jgi:luciferase family oxidoreductase group 1
MRLSVIDQSPVSAGFTAADALNNTIDLARLTDRLGYERYWIAEHHASEMLACSAPEILLARVGAETHHLRLGSGGVMLPHYSAMKVAEQFSMLHALYPGRIDLGLGRAPGGGPLETYALRRERGDKPMPDDFPDQLMELLAFLNRDFPDKHPFGRITLSPHMPGGPAVWLLGSSLWSAAAAAQVGLPYAFAHFISAEPTREAIEYYYRHFEPSRYLEKPRAIVALGALCAETDAEANRLIRSAHLVRRRFMTGVRGPVPTVEEAERELAQGDPGPRGENSEWPRYFVGTADSVKAGLTSMATALNVDEVMLVTIVHSHQARLRSYELLAQAFNLTPR